MKNEILHNCKLEAIQDLWSPHTLSLLTGVPRVGKTTFTLSAAKYIAVDRNIPTLLFSARSVTYCVKRLLVNTYNLETQVVYKNEQGEIELLDYTKYDDSYEPGFDIEKFKDEEAVERNLANDQTLREAPLYFYSVESLEEFESMTWIEKIRSSIIRHKIQYVFIDWNYWFLKERACKRPFLHSLKDLANELDCAIITTIFQCYLLHGEAPRLCPKQLEISPEELAAADIIMFLDRPHYNNAAKIIAKKPDGNLICNCDLLFVRKFARFVDADNRVCKN